MIKKEPHYLKEVHYCQVSERNETVLLYSFPNECRQLEGLIPFILKKLFAEAPFA